jgi:hypothetical protein
MSRILPAMLLMAAIGCGHHAGDGPKAKAKVEEHHGNEEGPHHGPIAEWGDCEYELEFTVDHKTQEATVYVFAGHKLKPAPIKLTAVTLTLKQTPPVTIELTAKPQDGDPAGTASRFVGKHAALAAEKHFAGTLSAVLDGKPYAGDFKEGDHAGHKH